MMNDGSGLDNFFEEDENSWNNETPTIESKDLMEPVRQNSLELDSEDDFDKAVLDIDYSEFKGKFKHALHKVKHKIGRRPRTKKPLTKNFEVKDKGRATIAGGRKQISKIVIPEGRDVSIQGVDDFILSNDHDQTKNIGYYKGKKLKELVLSISNTSGVDFDLELFNPSMPLDYLFNTNDNLNNRIVVAGQTNVSYTDLVYNLLANPTLIANARFTSTGPNVSQQKTQRLTFVNKGIDGEVTIAPLQLNLNFDLYQQQNDIILFDITSQLNRVFIPDGMDVIQYKVLAGNTVTFCFYYKQKSLKKFFYPEARVKKLVMGNEKKVI